MSYGLFFSPATWMLHTVILFMKRSGRGKQRDITFLPCPPPFLIVFAASVS